MKEFCVRLFHWVWGRRVSLHLDVVVFRSPSSFPPFGSAVITLLVALVVSLHANSPLGGKNKIGSWAGLVIVTVEPNFFIYSFI